MISVNRLRNVVMFLLDKENLGYISPSSFNEYCNLAQNVIFEDLFHQYAKYIVGQNQKRYNSEFSDIPKNVREMIDIFSTYTTTGNFILSGGVWSYTGTDFYRTQNLTLKTIATGKQVDIEEVSKTEINRLVNSSENPTFTYPVYTKIGETYKIYPTLTSSYEPELLFIRRPKDCKWTFVNVQGNPVYSATASDLQDCELHESLFSAMAVKVLGYAGLSLREQEVEAVANGEEMKEYQKRN